MVKTVSLTINGQTLNVPEGTLLVNAARQLGISIPVFCYHPKMEPVGMCRQCLVEVGRPVVDRASGQIVLENGQPKISFGPKLETACSTPVSEGMVVLTNSDKARSAQREILEFLLTSHPLDCPVCDKGGECPLQNLTMAFGPSGSRYLYDEKHHAGKHLPLGDLIWLDRERCIQCARCIRFQEQVAGEPVLAFYQRGRSTDIITNSEPPFDSIFSGNTSDICPVGALTTADFRFGARPWELNSAASLCAQCPVGCNLTLNTRREGSAGGRFVIKRVLPRQNEQVNEIWLCDKGRFAYHYTESTERLKEPLIRRDGQLLSSSWESALKTAAGKISPVVSDLVVLASGRLANEDLFNLKQLAEICGGRALLYTRMGGGEWTTTYGAAAGMNIGRMGPGTAILVVASDLYQEAPLWYLRIKQAAERGAELIVAGARATRLEEYARHVVRYSYGDEVTTIRSLIEKQPAGTALTSARNLLVLYGSDGLGLGGTSALAAACAELVQPRAGQPGSALIGVWPHANDQGAWELGYKPVEDLSRELQGKVIYIAGADPAGDDPHLVETLRSARAVIVQDLFMTATAQLADVVLPAQAYTEREGSLTSGERRVQRFYPAVPVLGESRTDYTITAQLARELGEEMEEHSAQRVMDRMAAEIPAFAGISYGRLAETSEQWPLVGRGDLYYGGTTYENRQGLGVTLGRSPLPAMSGRRAFKPLRVDEDRWLAVPITRLYDRGTALVASSLLEAHIGPATAYLHPNSAEKLGVQTGSQVEINGGRLEVRLEQGMPVGVVLIPRSMGVPLFDPAIVKVKKA
jgi:NADH-quinone oxidoreductase subunit G